MLEMQSASSSSGGYEWLQYTVITATTEVYKDAKGTRNNHSKRYNASTDCCKRTRNFPGCGGSHLVASILSRGIRIHNRTTLILQYWGTEKAQKLDKPQASQQSWIGEREHGACQGERWRGSNDIRVARRGHLYEIREPCVKCWEMQNLYSRWWESLKGCQ